MIYFIIGYIIFLIAFGIFSYAGLYHLIRYGYREGASTKMLFAYITVSISIIVVTFILLTIFGFSLPENIYLGF